MRLILALALELLSSPEPRASRPGLLSLRVDRPPESASIPFDQARRERCFLICGERGKVGSEPVVD